MMADDLLAGLVIAVLGGDRREEEVIRVLASAGASIRTAGRDLAADPRPAQPHPSVNGALRLADVLLAPLPSLGGDGRVWSTLASAPVYLLPADIEGMAHGARAIVGRANSCLRDLAAKGRLQLRELADDDELAILNSIPTAEGAVQLAMQLSPITMHGSTAAVLGMGRVGLTLARLLVAIGCRTFACAEERAARARALTLGCELASLDDLGRIADRLDFLFNTIPAPVVSRETLAGLSERAVVIDLASAPGGVDLAASRELGKTAVLAPGLPGKVAPVTAGKLLAQVVRDDLLNWSGKGRGGRCP